MSRLCLNDVIKTYIYSLTPNSLNLDSLDYRKNIKTPIYKFFTKSAVILISRIDMIDFRKLFQNTLSEGSSSSKFSPKKPQKWRFIMKTRSFLLAAGVVLTMALTFSCSSDEPDDNNPGGGGGYTGPYETPITINGQTYKTVKIGTQIWMTENLNYAVAGSKCYGEEGKVLISRDEDDNTITKTLSPAEVQANCVKYGRLYDWPTAKTVCPLGWHLPSNDDWDVLIDYAGGDETAGTKLKAKSGWNDNGNGTDEFGFSALPGGNGYLDDGDFDFAAIGYYSYWWSASEYSGDPDIRRMRHDREYVVLSSFRLSGLCYVRCVKD